MPRKKPIRPATGVNARPQQKRTAAEAGARFCSRTALLISLETSALLASPLGGAAALIDLMQLDHVAARVVDEDLLGLRAVDAGHRPVFDPKPVELGLGRLNVG